MKFKMNPEFERAQRDGWKIPLGVPEDEQIAALKEQAGKSGIQLNDEGAREILKQVLSEGDQ